MPEVTIEIPEYRAKTIPWGFSLNVAQGNDDQLYSNHSFDTDRYEPKAVRRMISAYQTLLNQLTVNPELRLAELRPAVLRNAA